MTFSALQGLVPSHLSKLCYDTKTSDSALLPKLWFQQIAHLRRDRPSQLDKPHKTFVVCSAAAHKGLEHNLQHLQLPITEKSNKSLSLV